MLQNRGQRHSQPQQRAITKRVREIKAKHGIKPYFEIKWNKVSPSKLQFFLDLIDYFFADPDLRFRALVVPNKKMLTFDGEGNDHDTWYFKMYFTMIKAILDPEKKYHIYLDIKDTRGAEKIRKLHEVLNNSLYDFDRKIVQRVQFVESKHVTHVQLADFLIGAVAYHNRGITDSKAKLEVIDRIKKLSGRNLTHSTLLRENKFNLFFWQPRNEVE